MYDKLYKKYVRMKDKKVFAYHCHTRTFLVFCCQQTPSLSLQTFGFRYCFCFDAENLITIRSRHTFDSIDYNLKKHVVQIKFMHTLMIRQISHRQIGDSDQNIKHRVSNRYRHSSFPLLVTYNSKNLLWFE